MVSTTKSLRDIYQELLNDPLISSETKASIKAEVEAKANKKLQA